MRIFMFVRGSVGICVNTVRLLLRMRKYKYKGEE